MSRGRGAIAALCAAVLLAIGSAEAPAATSVTTIPGLDYANTLWPGPDGSSWGNAYDPSGGVRIIRVGAAGLLSRTDPPTGGSLDLRNGGMLVLPDGAVAAFLRASSAPALVRFDAATGQAARVTRLPASAEGAYGLAVAPDGAVWFARSCEDKVGRVLPGSDRVEHVQLPALGCGTLAKGRELGARLAFDSNGALWLVNLCMGRIDRIGLSRRVREWRAPGIACDDYYGVRTTIAVDPHGGVSYAARGGFGAGSGRVHDGRRERFDNYGAGVFTGDGALWREVLRGVERRDPDGTRTLVRTPATLSDLVPTRGGGVAVVGASFWRSYGGDSHNLPTPAYLDTHILSISPDGAQTAYALPDGGTDAPWQVSGANLSLGPDGAFYVGEGLVSLDGLGYSSRLLRAIPDTLEPPAAPIARVARTLGRVGRTVWLQLSCGAEPGRYCIGTATLGGSNIAHAARFAIAGQARGAVPVRLDWRGARTLVRRGELRAPAIVRSGGTETRRSLAIRR
jgi:streptogramin lyase